MAMKPSHAPVDPTADARRKRVRRTAWLFAGIALAVYAGFILSGVVGR